jgi:3-deoxy-D-manno-octulosonic acid kinase
VRGGRTAAVAAPEGYERFTVGDTIVVARQDASAGVREALGVCRTLHAWASTLPGATAHQGRATAWGARLPRTEIDVVVRHAQHGGLLAPLTGDLFRMPSRAPWELTASRRLHEAGVPTPDLICYLVYPAGLGFCRADVATRRLPAGEDLPAAWRRAAREERDDMLDAVALLLRDLHRAGAHHPDLNAKNIYLTRADRADGWTAYVLDVDRVQFLAPGDALAGAGNAARLRRSLLKWRDKGGLVITDAQLALLAHDAEALA